MTPKKPKKPPDPAPIISAADVKAFKPPDDTAAAYASLISTGPKGLTTKGRTTKRTLLGGSPGGSLN